MECNPFKAAGGVRILNTCATNVAVNQWQHGQDIACDMYVDVFYSLADEYRTTCLGESPVSKPSSTQKEDLVNNNHGPSHVDLSDLTFSGQSDGIQGRIKDDVGENTGPSSGKNVNTSIGSGRSAELERTNSHEQAFLESKSIPKASLFSKLARKISLGKAVGVVRKLGFGRRRSSQKAKVPVGNLKSREGSNVDCKARTGHDQNFERKVMEVKEKVNFKGDSERGTIHRCVHTSDRTQQHQVSFLQSATRLEDRLNSNRTRDSMRVTVDKMTRGHKMVADVVETAASDLVCDRALQEEGDPEKRTKKKSKLLTFFGLKKAII